VARYLLLADVLALIFVVTYSGVSRSGTVDLVFNVLYYALPFLGVLSLLGIIDRHTSSEVNIGANPERVFALLVDPDAWVRHGGTWLGRYRSIERTETAASGGTKGRALTVSLGLPGEMQWEMLEYEPPRRVVTLARSKWIGLVPAISLASYSLQSTGGGVYVRCELESRNLGLVLSRSLGSRTLARLTDRMLAQLKSEAEQPSSA
jgi:uncharacterized protein YndB with AHSA1/START domain